MKNKFSKLVIAVALSASLLATGLCGCQQEVKENRVSNSDDLLASVQKSDTAPTYDFNSDTEKPESYDNYIKKSCDLGINLLRGEDYKNKNTIVAPIAVSSSLSALANGTSKDTLKELKGVLGKSSYTNEVINQCNAFITQRLGFLNTDTTGVYNISSLWVKSDYSPKRSFLQKYDNFYEDVFAYKANFASSNINEVIKNFSFDNTKEIISPKCIATKEDYSLYLDSSVAVSDNWLIPYDENSVAQGSFTTADGKAINVNYLTSVEKSFTTDKVKGFVKDLGNTPCKMVFVMPNEDITLDKYVSQLNAEKFLSLMQDMKPTNFVNAKIPEFSISESASIKENLQNVGVSDIFKESADFTKGFTEKAFVNDFTQSATITVNQKGVTFNGTANDTETEGVSQQANVDLIINRPFLYAVVDNDSYAPIIIGTVNNPQA